MRCNIGPDFSSSDPSSKDCNRFQDLCARLHDRHLFCYLAQHCDLGRGVPDVVIARAQAARCHLEHFAKSYRSTERLLLEQLACVLEIPGSLIVVVSMPGHWTRSSIGWRFYALGPRSVAGCARRCRARIRIRIVSARGGRLALRASWRDDRRRHIRVHRRREAGRERWVKCRDRGGRRPGALSRVGIVHAHTSAVVCASVRVDAAYACGRRRLINSGRYRRVVSGRRHTAAERTKQTRRNQAFDICSADHVPLPLAHYPESVQ
jgi:hypothetical protein